MFGKNYDDQIKQLIDVNNNLVKSNNLNTQAISDMRERLDSLMDNMINIAKIQSQHKAIVSFLLNHASVDSDAKEDLYKMLGQIKQVEEDIEEINKPKTKPKKKNDRQTQKKETVKGSVKKHNL